MTRNVEQFSCDNTNALVTPVVAYRPEQRQMYSMPAGDERYVQYQQVPHIVKDSNARPLALPVWQPASYEHIYPPPQSCGHVTHTAAEHIAYSNAAGSFVAPPLLPPAVPQAAAVPPMVSIPVVGSSFISSPPTSCYSAEARGPPSFPQHTSAVSPCQSPPRKVSHASASAATASESESSFSGETPPQPSSAPAAEAATPQALAEYNKRRCCQHNSWDNVRVTKGLMTLRCRICQKQWRVRVDLVWNQLKCEAFNSEHSCTNENCPMLHLHYRKQSLEDRFKNHGATVLDHVKAGRITKDVMSKVVKLESTDDMGKTGSTGSRGSRTRRSGDASRVEEQSSPVSTGYASSTSSLDSAKATLHASATSMNMTLAPVLPEPSSGSNSLSSTFAIPPSESPSHAPISYFPQTSSPQLAVRPLSSPPMTGAAPQTPSPNSDQTLSAPASYSHDPYKI